jgi:tRNA(adenine34) deaminase
VRAASPTKRVSSRRAADEAFMLRAIGIARSALEKPGTSPIGCVIVLDGEIVATAHNEVGMRCDPTAHAEVVAIRRAGARLKSPDMRGAVLYTTLQPCGMCTMASIWAGVSRIVFGAGRNDVHQMYFEDRHLDSVDFIADAFREHLTILGGVLSDRCAKLYHKPGEHVPKSEQANI